MSTFNPKDFFEPEYNNINNFIMEKDLELLGDSRNLIAIPDNLPDDLKKYLLTAMKAHVLGLTMDHVYNRYTKDSTFPKKHSDIYYDLNKSILDSIWQLHTDMMERMLKLENLNGSLGFEAAVAALVRLESSFRIAVFLLKSGYHFDGMSIVKLIFEQVSWAFAVCTVDDDSMYNIQPSKTITKLKDFISWAGILYGNINDESHIATNQIKKITLLEEGQKRVFLNNYEYSIDSSFLFLKVTDCYCIIAEYLYKNCFKDLIFIDNNLMPNDKRVSKKLLDNFANKIYKLKSKSI